jgi:hypothetical protein
MDEFSLFIVSALVGGIVVALLLTRLNRHWQGRSAGVDRGDRPRSTDAINIASIRVAGIGGLGLVAMALIVAVFIPRIGVSLAIASGLGAVLGVGLILWRRPTGSMPSSGRRRGASAMLPIDSPETPSPDGRDGQEKRRAAATDARPAAIL